METDYPSTTLALPTRRVIKAEVLDEATAQSFPDAREEAEQFSNSSCTAPPLLPRAAGIVIRLLSKGSKLPWCFILSLSIHRTEPNHYQVSWQDAGQHRQRIMYVMSSAYDISLQSFGTGSRSMTCNNRFHSVGTKTDPCEHLIVVVFHPTRQLTHRPTRLFE
ncbi:hypothetical protein EVAR_42536_1 [Eumeta japonica]|uniref:Uncharacterized protein n=1 Tax=Eumeta variegata TaxID=151549 RepID=A0A4C1WR06_EUMVA|nr:hypothetical protein EVAR_42536_1 [Eumeta japonica]